MTNTAPTISSIANQTTNEDTPTPTIALTSCRIDHEKKSAIVIPHT